MGSSFAARAVRVCCSGAAAWHLRHWRGSSGIRQESAGGWTEPLCHSRNAGRLYDATNDWMELQWRAVPLVESVHHSSAALYRGKSDPSASNAFTSCKYAATAVDDAKRCRLTARGQAGSRVPGYASNESVRFKEKLPARCGHIPITPHRCRVQGARVQGASAKQKPELPLKVAAQVQSLRHGSPAAAMVTPRSN